jgi:hypothetical protein
VRRIIIIDANNGNEMLYNDERNVENARRCIAVSGFLPLGFLVQTNTDRSS